MNSPEKFAISLVSLALLRKGYVTSSEVQLSSNERADILAVRDDGQDQERFVVEVECVTGRDSIPEELDGCRKRLSNAFGLATYLAFFIDKEDILIVDEELHKRMRFIDEEVRLETIPRKVLASK